VLSTGPTPEERLEELLAERRRELDEAAARFDASIADLERREELLRDSRASVERMLRLGRGDLEARENELTDFLRELTEREARIAETEAEIARRRQELGAVELKRATVERRERDLAAREAQLAELEAEAVKREAQVIPGEPRAETVELVFVSGPSYRLVERSVGDLVPGTTVEIDAEAYVVERIGPSPLPGDRRRCAFLIGSAHGRGSHGSS
jgi:multidrug efflux pump subunit AcrA (membrane-fusion protein)